MSKFNVFIIFLSFLYYTNQTFSLPRTNAHPNTEVDQTLSQINQLRSVTKQHLGRFLSNYFVYASTDKNSSFLHPDNSNNDAFEFSRVNGKDTYSVKPDLVDQFIKAVILLTNPQLGESVNIELENLPKLVNFEAAQQFLEEFLNPKNSKFLFHDAYHEHKDSIKSQFLYQILSNKNGPNISEFKLYVVSLFNPNQSSLKDQLTTYKEKFGWGTLYGDLTDANLINLYNDKPQMRGLILNLVDSFFPLFDIDLKSIDSRFDFFPKHVNTITGFNFDNSQKGKFIESPLTFYRSTDLINYFINSVINSSVIINSYGDDRDKESLNKLMLSLQGKPKYIQDMLNNSENPKYVNEQLEGMLAFMKMLESDRVIIQDIRKIKEIENDQKTRFINWKNFLVQLKLNFQIKAMRERYKILFSSNATTFDVFDKILAVISGEFSSKKFQHESVKNSLVKILNQNIEDNIKLIQITDLLNASFQNDTKTDFRALADQLLQRHRQGTFSNSNHLAPRLINQSVTNTNQCSALFMNW